MENTIDRPNYLRESTLSFQQIEEGFDDWVRWLSSIMHTAEDSSTTQPVEQRVGPGEEPPGAQGHSDRELEGEWRWVDDGGEGGEVV